VAKAARHLAGRGPARAGVHHHQAAAGAAGRERRTLDDSLRAPGMDYVGLWLVHQPPPGRALVSTWQEVLAIRRSTDPWAPPYDAALHSDLRHPVLAEIAAAHRVTPAQVVLRWHVDHQLVIPKSAIPSGSRPTST
jgi:2,5-diketo-D-gluconate reductase A